MVLSILTVKTVIIVVQIAAFTQSTKHFLYTNIFYVHLFTVSPHYSVLQDKVSLVERWE